MIILIILMIILIMVIPQTVWPHLGFLRSGLGPGVQYKRGVAVLGHGLIPLHFRIKWKKGLATVFLPSQPLTCVHPSLSLSLSRSCHILLQILTPHCLGSLSGISLVAILIAVVSQCYCDYQEHHCA